MGRPLLFVPGGSAFLRRTGSSTSQEQRIRPRTLSCKLRNHELSRNVSAATMLPISKSLLAPSLPIGLTQLTRRPAPRRRVFRLVILASIAVVAALLRAAPSFASAAVGTSTAALGEPAGFVAGLTASFALVLASEIGDKTFFISALLSMKYSRLLVLLGTMLALGMMTVISVAIGQVFHALPTSLNSRIPFDDYAAVALLLWFGYQNIRDGLSMGQTEAGELQGARDVIASARQSSPSGVRVVSETSSLVFFAEWGDKSMLATIALAAAKSPLGVIVGGVSGHLVASIIAVIGGSFLGKYISEKSARLVGGFLFLLFAALTLLGLY